MTALISGNHGFIGSHLTTALKRLGVAVVRIPTPLLAHPHALQTFISVEEPDLVFHLAAFGNHRQQKNAQEIFDANVIGTWNLLQACRNEALKAFINVGSSSEYGRKSQRMTEDDVAKPETVYGASKLATTALARALAITRDQPIVTVRPFSVYGEGEADFRFIPTVVRALQTGEALQLDPLAQHDWIYVTDLIAGILAVVDHAKELKGQVVNLGTGLPYSNRDIVATLELISGRKANIKLDPKLSRTGDSDYWAADNTTLKGLGWQQTFSLLDGLTATYYGLLKHTKGA